MKEAAQKILLISWLQLSVIISGFKLKMIWFLIQNFTAQENADTGMVA